VKISQLLKKLIELGWHTTDSWTWSHKLVFPYKENKRRKVNSISVSITNMEFDYLFAVFLIVSNYLITYEPYHIFVNKKWTCNSRDVVSEVLTAVVMKSSTSWDIRVTLCSPLKFNRRFGLPPAFMLVSCSAYSTLKMEAKCSSETSLDVISQKTVLFISQRCMQNRK
jgi:hypothetical protein